MLDELVRHAAPDGFLAKRGVATQVAATLLVTTGDNHASSGKQIRHRLNAVATGRPTPPSQPCSLAS